MNALSSTILVVLAAVVIISSSRRWALLGMMAGILYLPQSSSLSVFNFNMFAFRFLEIAGIVRIIARREIRFSEMNGLDHLFLIVYGYATFVFLLRSPEGQTYQIGLFVDATISYFIFRGLICEIGDFRWLLKALVILLVPYVALVFVEMRTSNNLFSLLGSIEMGGGMRDGKMRCVGSFQHPSLLGTLGASFLPLYIAFFLDQELRRWGFTGIILCGLLILLSNSGGPIAALGFGIVCWCFWPIRYKMRIVRWTVLCIICLLALFMKAPIWFLPARISDIVGGDGFHRSYLMDCAIRDLSKWWFSGMPIVDTANWFPYVVPATGGADITNQYLFFGVTGGLLAIILFILLLIKCYSLLGNSMYQLRASTSTPTGNEFLLWGLGVMLTVHISNWFGIRYFDQTYNLWFMQLAAISVTKAEVLPKVKTKNGVVFGAFQ